MSYDKAHSRGNNYVRNQVAFSIKSHWFKFSFKSPLERHYLIARAYCAVRVGYAHRTGKSTANILQASRGISRSWTPVGKGTMYRLEFAKYLRTEIDVAGYFLVPINGPSVPENCPKVRMNRHIETLVEYVAYSLSKCSKSLQFVKNCNNLLYCMYLVALAMID